MKLAFGVDSELPGVCEYQSANSAFPLIMTRHLNFITLTETGTVTVTQSVVAATPSGMASNGIVFGATGLCLTSLLCVLLL